MAFNLKALENHSGSGAGLRLFSYKAGADNRAAVKGTGYFNSAAGILRVGDRIFVQSSDVSFDCQVSAISAGAVTIAALGAFA